MERERRWTCYLYDDKQFWERLKEDFSGYDEIVTQINGLVMEIDKLGEKHITTHNQRKKQRKCLPNVEILMRQIDLGDAYFQYRLLSQYTHSSHAAFLQLKHFFSTQEEYACGEMRLPIEWLWSFQICWNSLELLGKQLLSLVNQDPTAFPEPSLLHKFKLAIGSLGEAFDKGLVSPG